MLSYIFDKLQKHFIKWWDIYNLCTGKRSSHLGVRWDKMWQVVRQNGKMCEESRVLLISENKNAHEQNIN